jgi:signal transduction histidine kinase
MVKNKREMANLNLQLSYQNIKIPLYLRVSFFIFECLCSKINADESRNKLTGGVGIGLTISKSIVEAHKGNIIVESRMDQGTEFIVKIPKKV